MKKIVIPLLLLLCTYSCQKENTVFEEEEIQTTAKRNGFSTLDEYSPREILEINLRWTAYIAGSVLRNDTGAQNQIALLLQNGNNSIKLHQLLENNTAFANKFIEQTNFYLLIGYPNHDKTRPNPPPQGIGDGHSNSTAMFIDYILNNQCIELYFPKSMNYSVNYNITTTGHPMNATDDSNDGIIRYFSPQLMTHNDFQDIFSTTHHVTVTDTYVQSNDNIIIARPYRNSNTPIAGIDCFYTQYNDITDFTDFLDY